MRALPAEAGLPVLLDALRAALDGTGPPLLPLPAGAAASAVLRALRPEEPLEYDDVALVVPTSGTSGEPKGVLLSTEALRASATATHERLGGAGQWLLALPTTHIAGIQVLVRSLLAATEPVALPLGPFRPEQLASATAAMGPGRHYVSLVPTQLRRVLDSGGEPLSALASYDAVLVGGAAAPPVLLVQAREAGVAVVTTYGTSETSGGCVYDEVPLPGVLVDTHDGVVRIGGPMLALGYRLRPDLTRAAFSDGWFTTSDVGRFHHGRLSVVGRADDIIVTGGEKIAPAAVEAALAAHPAVAEVVVVGVPDAEWGQRVVAVVRQREGQVLSLDEARRHVATVLARAAAPSELRVVQSIPMLPSGKPDRAALAAK